MCGILAYISKEKIKDSNIFNVKKLMSCRGPDNQSYNRFKFGDQFLHLFHSRLSIQDLNKRSDQPFRFKNYIIIFNGEIYNFRNLRNKFKETKFKTLSDTEVILHYYNVFKEKCFSMFEGMWSLIIYDIKKNKLIVSRDKFGEKPILIYRSSNEIIISSQVSYIRELKKMKILSLIMKK